MKKINIYDTLNKNNNLTMIVNEKNLLEYIRNYPFLDIETKNSIIKYFDELTSNQVFWLINYFNDEKNNILNLLRSLKDKKEVTNFEEIKTQIDSFWRNKLKLEELLESKKEKEEISNLINEIDNF